MALLTKAIKGTADITGKDSYKWQNVERILLQTAQNFGFSEVRFPTIEHTELFVRSVGDTTDVVQKEMYTFADKGGRSVTMRPEGTAGAMRLALENGLLNDALPLKMCYLSSCFRYESPQEGRLREFHQFGVEAVGGALPLLDAEVILLADKIFKWFGLQNVQLFINSIGCKECRRSFTDALVEFFSAKKDTLCPTCLARLDKNPMRILDCKSPVCGEVSKDAPNCLDYICDECSDHFEGVKAYLSAAGVAYTINPRIVRGLDYYTKTVFEFVSSSLGAQNTLCAGGRYDGLIENLGGAPTPAVGFGMGLERLIMTLERQGRFLGELKCPDIFIASIGEKARLKAFTLTNILRENGSYAECDCMNRSLKAQMKYAVSRH